ncbi:MAG: DUF362 domain-containing protein [Bacteroidales bacterium]|jgi:uncharacterized protein (DUF362 family)
MKKNNISRRKFISSATVAAIGSSVFGLNRIYGKSNNGISPKEIVSIVRVKDGNISKAVEEAINHLGGIETVTRGKNSILLKPNLVAPDVNCTTKPEVVKAIAQLMLKSGKKVMIGEASAAAESFNVIGDDTYRTRKKEILDGMQKHVFDTLGYTEMAKSLNLPLINLHSGDIIEVPLKDGFAANSLKIHKVLTEVDLVCSVPMMKTHTLATVTLAMKNLIGLYPGTEYYSVRSWLHDRAAEKGSPGVAFEVIDMNRAVKTGFSVIDATSAMEGNGPFGGALVDMGLIIAGTSPLATDMVGATIMGFELDEIPAIVLAHKAGMAPLNLHDIEIRGLSIEQTRRNFVKPQVSRWTDINKFWGIKEL